MLERTALPAAFFAGNSLARTHTHIYARTHNPAVTLNTLSISILSKTRSRHAAVTLLPMLRVIRSIGSRSGLLATPKEPPPPPSSPPIA